MREAQTVEKVHCRGEHCSPVPVCLGRDFPGKCVAAVSWRATNGRPYTRNRARMQFFDGLKNSHLRCRRSRISDGYFLWQYRRQAFPFLGRLPGGFLFISRRFWFTRQQTPQPIPNSKMCGFLYGVLRLCLSWARYSAGVMPYSARKLFKKLL